MTVEERKGGLAVEDGANDPFPVGMRVLAVDDDPTCLRLLEGLLRRCQYQGLVLLCFACLLLYIDFGLIPETWGFYFSLRNLFYSILCFFEVELKFL